MAAHERICVESINGGQIGAAFHRQRNETNVTGVGSGAIFFIDTGVSPRHAEIGCGMGQQERRTYGTWRTDRRGATGFKWTRRTWRAPQIYQPGTSGSCSWPEPTRLWVKACSEAVTTDKRGLTSD